MQLTYRALITVLLTLSLTAVAHCDELLKEIDTANKAFAAAILDGDVDHLVNDYTDDACVMAPTSPIICGKEAIRGFWNAVVASNPNNVEIITLDAGGEAALSYAHGILNITDASGTLHVNNFVLVYKNVKGSWKLHRDTWTPQ